MRLVCVATVLLAGIPASAEPPKTSDPAFLGIGMQDIGPAGPCRVDQVTVGSGAEAGGLRIGDIIVSFDKVRIDTCASLLAAVTSHERGELVQIEVIDHGQAARQLKVQLPSRGEILHRRFVGKRLDGVELVAAGDFTKHSDLSDLHGRAAIVGWFSPTCSDCKWVFGKLAGRPEERASKTPPALAIGITTLGTFQSSDVKKLQEDGQRLQKAIDVPLSLTDEATFHDTLPINDPERVTFMVIDCRGFVQYVVPIKPDSDDLDAALDELYAAADQARMTRPQ